MLAFEYHRTVQTTKYAAAETARPSVVFLENALSEGLQRVGMGHTNSA